MARATLGSNRTCGFSITYRTPASPGRVVATPASHSRLGTITATVVLLAMCFAIGCTRDVPAGRPNLLLIVVDTLRYDHLHCYGHDRETSPRIDALASESIRFERAYSTGPWTKPSIGSLHTGLYPSHHRSDKMLRPLPETAETLAETLAAAGYRTGAVVSHSLIGSKHNFDQGFEEFVESEARGHHHVSTAAVTDQAISLMDDLDSRGDPFFLFVHYFDPHDTYQPHPEYGYASKGAGRIKPGMGSGPLRKLDPAPQGDEVQLLRDLYDEEIRHTDAGIGRLLEALRKAGHDANSLVILTADHGEEFLERGWLGHGNSLFEELIRVPLLIRPPRAKAAQRVIRQPVSTVSLVPTILDILNVPAGDAHFDGPSLRTLVEGGAQPAEPFYAELSYKPGKKLRGLWLRAVIDGSRKLIEDIPAGTYSMYDLESDPNETVDRKSDQPGAFASLKHLLDRGPSPDSGKGPPAVNVELSERELEILRKLGYGRGDK